MDILVKRPSDDEQIAEAIKRLMTAIQKRERRVSVAGLIRSNLGNAAAVWSATGGHPAWMLHLTYLADAVGKKLTIADITERRVQVPQILAINGSSRKLGLHHGGETENGGNSGIDTIMRTLAEKRLIEDRAPTLDGSWMQRIMDARSANGNFLHSTMTPFSRLLWHVGSARQRLRRRRGAHWAVGADKAIRPFSTRSSILRSYYLGSTGSASRSCCS